MVETENVMAELGECAEKGDFKGAFGLARDNQAELAKGIGPEGVRDLLKKATKDRLLLSFIDEAQFGARPIGESFVRLERLMGLEPGARVLSKSLEWGLGIVKRLDYFYRRITVDFRAKKGHQFSYEAALDMLTAANDDHILVMQHADPERFQALMKDASGEFVKAVLRSFGPMSIQRLEDVCVKCGFVKAAAWKGFWEKARGELRRDKLVVIPVKRTDPIEIKASAEDYGDGWLSAFSHETDPKLILSGVREYVAKGNFAKASEQAKATIGERLAFAVTAARRVDDALYARLAATVRDLKFERPSAAEMRDYLWERRRFVAAAAALPAREVGALVSFLAVDDDSRAKLCKAIPELCYTAVLEIVTQFAKDDASRKTIADFMRLPKAPPTLTTLFVGSYQKYRETWPELPPFISLLTHAIALGEGRQNGETLRMQNIIRRLFADKNWLEKVFSWLGKEDLALLFERFQASIAWDPSTHHAIVVRMTRLAPELEGHLVKAEKKREYARVTSPRSFAKRKLEYLKLINEDMPENIRKIEFAKGFGDLSENVEYQYAKDEQRTLMHKQAEMQDELAAVKPHDFSDATADEVMPGVTVRVDTPEGTKTYTILGEWDNDIEKGVISSKTRLAESLLGKKAGDSFELPSADGKLVLGKVAAIEPLTPELRAWLAEVPPGVVL